MLSIHKAPFLRSVLGSVTQSYCLGSSLAKRALLFPPFGALPYSNCKCWQWNSSFVKYRAVLWIYYSALGQWRLGGRSEQLGPLTMQWVQVRVSTLLLNVFLVSNTMTLMLTNIPCVSFMKTSWNVGYCSPHWVAVIFSSLGALEAEQNTCLNMCRVEEEVGPCKQ